MLQFQLLFADVIAVAALCIVLLQDAPTAITSVGWPAVVLGYLPVVIILATSVATWLKSKETLAESKKTTAMAVSVKEEVAGVKQQQVVLEKKQDDTHTLVNSGSLVQLDLILAMATELHAAKPTPENKARVVAAEKARATHLTKQAVVDDRSLHGKTN